MNLNIIKWFFGLVFLEIVGCVLAGLRFEQLVKFTCEICAPEPDECCVGTVIHKDVILTTSYCATSCQSIHKYSRNINIVKTYKQPRMETKTRHDIALVIINIDWKLRWTAKLNPINAFSGIGLKAYYPFMDDGNTRMREMILEKCGKPGQRIYGNHVCGAKTNNTETKKCFQRQGVPLLLHGKIIAVTAATNNKLCNHEQMVFNTIDPELSWINSTIAELYPDDRLNEIDSEPAPDHNRSSLEPSTIISTQIPATNTTVPIPTTRSKPTLTTLTTNVTENSMPTRTPHTPLETLKLISSLMSTRPNETTSEAKEGKYATEIPHLLNRSISFADITFPIFSKQTDVMEWFNQKVRSKIKAGNYSYFVLTTVKPNYDSTAFVDLTV